MPAFTLLLADNQNVGAVRRNLLAALDFCQDCDLQFVQIVNGKLAYAIEDVHAFSQMTCLEGIVR